MSSKQIQFSNIFFFFTIFKTKDTKLNLYLTILINIFKICQNSFSDWSYLKKIAISSSSPIALLPLPWRVHCTFWDFIKIDLLSMDLFLIYWYIRLVFCVLVVRGPFREFFQSQGCWNQLTLQWTHLTEQLLVQCTVHICILFVAFPLLPVTVVFLFLENLPCMLWPCIMWKLSLKSFIGQTDRNMRPKIKPSRKNIRFLICINVTKYGFSPLHV